MNIIQHWFDLELSRDTTRDEIRCDDARVQRDLRIVNLVRSHKNYEPYRDELVKDSRALNYFRVRSAL